MVFQIVGIFVGIILFVFGFSILKRKHQIEHTPTSKIRSMAMGIVEIKGKAHAETSVISPFTKKKCVYYISYIEEEKGSGKSRHWEKIHTNLHVNPFYVKDDTGEILINPRGATVELSPTFEDSSGFGKDPSKVVMDYLKEHNLKFEGFFGMNKKMRYTEKAIFLDGEVYVLGEAMSSGNASSVQHENIVIGKKGKWGMYYISNMPEKEIVKKFNRVIYPLFIIGGIIIIICVMSIVMAIVTYN